MKNINLFRTIAVSITRKNLEIRKTWNRNEWKFVICF